MVSYNSQPVYDLNSYLWQKLQDNQILDPNNYVADNFDTYLTPILPAQQIPEFNNLLPGQTYLIYDFEEQPTNENWWISNQIVTYTIVSPSYDNINQIISLIKDTFRRHDESANDVNNYSGNSKIYNFHYIIVDSAMSPQHFTSEGGFMMGEIKLFISYARNLDSNKRYM